MTDDKIAKLVVPSYGLRGEFARVELTDDEFEDMHNEYLNEQINLVNTVADREDVFKLDSNTTRMLLDKMIPPFQYWLENKIACKKATENKARTSEIDTKRKAKANEFANRVNSPTKSL